MKIGLIDVDGYNFPNLALMKISNYHKLIGDNVEWYSGFNYYDKVYMSKVFTFTPDYNFFIQADEVIKGGTGYKLYNDLFCETINPDYNLYPINNKWYDGKTSYGFITRGCIRKCSWCVVPHKEGNIRPSMDIEDILNGNKKAILLDNNILSCDYGLLQIEKIIKLGCKVDFNQGLDCRLVTNEVAKMLSKVKWIKYIRFSLDSKEQFEPLIKAIAKLNKNGISNSKIFTYVLLQKFKDSYNRINQCKKLGINPFAQPYRDFTPNQIIPQWQRDMARWCNHKALLKSIDFKEYYPRKGFFCKEYFNMGDL